MAVIEILMRPQTIIAARNSRTVIGVTKRFTRLRVHSSMRNEMEIPCWTRKNTSHRMRALSSNPTMATPPSRRPRYRERKPKKNRSTSGQ